MKSVLSLLLFAISIPLSGCVNPLMIGGPKETLKCNALSSTLRDADGNESNIVTEICHGTYEKRGTGAYPTFPESRKDGDWSYRKNR